MIARILMLAALASIPVAAWAHDDAHRAMMPGVTRTLAPGKSGEMVWQFTKAGTVDFACLQPGHFEAGMMGAVSVK